jgi:hypothetical protein
MNIDWSKVDFAAKNKEWDALLAATPVETPKINCPRCGGSGRIPSYSHIKAGECFKCHGSGRK